MCLRAPPTTFIFWPLAKFSLPLAKIYRVAPVFVFFKRLNVLQCVNKRNIIAELSQIKELLKTELTPMHAKLVVVEEKFEQLTNLYEFLSAKYNELLEQSKVTNEKITGLLKSTKTMQAEINSNKNMALKTMGETEEMAQYLQRDCLKISRVKPNTEYSSENIVESMEKVLNVNVTDADISNAHPLPSHKKDALPKLIVKFTHRNVRNEFYAKRKVLAGKNLPADPVLKNFLVGKNIYISESLTPQRKKLYSDINRFRKEIMWKFIWSHNGRIYLKKNETVTNHHAFDNTNDFAKFKDRFKAS